MNTQAHAGGEPATRAVVISDLHLGGSSPHMMSHPDQLAKFLKSLPMRLQADERLEVVIAGDFIDFLAIPAYASWTVDPRAARDKLERTTSGDSPFAPVFTELAGLLRLRHNLTILVGNHDVELALPGVQEALLARLGASRHQVLFVDDGRAYQIGQALIEHGNRYDGANVNDWSNLRTIVSAQSRNEIPPVALEVSAGSVIVEKIVNTIKPAYPFIDLLQPQGELVALLLIAFEPSLIWQFDKLARLLRGRRQEQANRQGVQPGKPRNVAYQPLDEEDAELRAAFGGLYERLRRPSTQKGFGDLIATAWASSQDSLAATLRRGDPVPAERLDQIRLVMRRMLLADRTAHLDGPIAQYGAAAKRMIADSAGKLTTVVMGHTHQARSLGDPERAWYINTGTWADLIRVPALALEDNRALEQFLRELLGGQQRNLHPTYANLRIESDGQVSLAKLESAAS